MSKMAPRQPKDTKGSSGTKKRFTQRPKCTQNLLSSPMEPQQDKGRLKGNPNWSKGTPKEAHKGPMHSK